MVAYLHLLPPLHLLGHCQLPSLLRHFQYRLHRFPFQPRHHPFVLRQPSRRRPLAYLPSWEHRQLVSLHQREQLFWKNEINYINSKCWPVFACVSEIWYPILVFDYKCSFTRNKFRNLISQLQNITWRLDLVPQLVESCTRKKSRD